MLACGKKGVYFGFLLGVYSWGLLLVYFGRPLWGSTLWGYSGGLLWGSTLGVYRGSTILGQRILDLEERTPLGVCSGGLL